MSVQLGDAATQSAFDRPGRPHLFWRCFCYACILCAVVSGLMYARSAFIDPESYGGVASNSLGGLLTRTNQDGRVDVVVHSLQSDTALARAGVKNGDRLRLDIPWNDFRTLATGEVFGFTRIAPGPSQHVAFAVPQFTGHSRSVANYRFLITVFDLGIGLLLFVRCRGDIGVEALAMAFIAAAMSIDFPVSPSAAIFWITVAYAGAAMLPFLTLAFAMSFYGRHTRGITRTERRIFWLLALGLTIGFVCSFFSNCLAYTNWFIRLNNVLLLVEEMLTYAATIYYFASGYRRARGDLKKRFAFLQLALVLTFCVTLVNAFSFLALKESRTDDASGLLYAINVALSLLGPLLFAYSVLRHRVVDIGFVLSRTLVYGVLSLMLLATFGLVEWAVDHIFKPAGEGENAVVEAAIAVGIFLVFHRVRDAVENRLESVFFRGWHDNEERLRRFVAEAPFITRAENLKSALVAELVRFSGGANVTVYLREPDSDYRAFAAPSLSGGAALDADDAALVALRARRRPVDPADLGSMLGAGLAAPMFQRNVLLGIAMLGGKPSGDDYRPDEIDVVADAVHHIGLDLEALKIEQLERETAELMRTVRQLKSDLARLRLGAAATRGES